MAQHKQAPPVPGVQDVTPALIADLQARAEEGLRTYGLPLQTWNGRNALQDAYEESLDQSAYLKQALMEQEAERERRVQGSSRPVQVLSPLICYTCEKLVQSGDGYPFTAWLNDSDDEWAFFCSAGCAGEPEPVQAATLPAVQRPTNLDHVDGGQFVYPNGARSAIRRQCGVCGAGYDPAWRVECGGCPGPVLHGS